MSNPVAPPPPHGGGSVPPPPPGYGPQPPEQGFGPAPEQGSGPTPEQGFGPAPEQPAKKRGPGRTIAKIAIGLLVVLVIAGLKFGVAKGISEAFFGDKAADAKVGDCIAEMPSVAVGEQKDADAKIVPCTSGDAAYTVVGRVNDQTEAQAQQAKGCEQYFKEGEEFSVYSSIPRGGKGYLLCLRAKA